MQTEQFEQNSSAHIINALVSAYLDEDDGNLRSQHLQKLDDFLTSRKLPTKNARFEQLHSHLVNDKGDYQQEKLDQTRVFALIEAFRKPYYFQIAYTDYKRLLGNSLSCPEIAPTAGLRVYFRSVANDQQAKAVAIQCIRHCLDDALQHERVIQGHIHRLWQNPHGCNGDYQKLCQLLDPNNLKRKDFESSDNDIMSIRGYLLDSRQLIRDITRYCVTQYSIAPTYTAADLPARILVEQVIPKLDEKDCRQFLVASRYLHNVFKQYRLPKDRRELNSVIPALLFTNNNNSEPSVTVYTGQNLGSDSRSYAELVRFSNDGVHPRSQFVQCLLGKSIPKATLHNDNGTVSEHLPTWAVKSADSFDLISELDASLLKLPLNFFLNCNGRHDTAPSVEGLTELMRHYSKHAKTTARVFTKADKFSLFINNLEENDWENPITCLAFFSPSERHVTGFYFDNKDNQKIVYIFDTTGLTLPAFPCGHRGYQGSYLTPLENLFGTLKSKDIKIAVMPMNTAFSLQHDSFSCLMATLMFFQGMRSHAFEMLSEPGITETYGDSAFSREENEHYQIKIKQKDFYVLLYATSYIPLLAGVQSTLGFLFMLDPLEHSDRLFSSLIKIRTDWQRKITGQKKSEVQHTYNLFWQVAYLKLLQWFEAVHHGKEAPFPDFESLCYEAKPRSEMSQFEQRHEAYINSNTKIATQNDMHKAKLHPTVPAVEKASGTGQTAVTTLESLINSLNNIPKKIAHPSNQQAEALQQITQYCSDLTQLSELRALRDRLVNQGHQQQGLAYLFSRQGFITLSLRRHQFFTPTGETVDCSETAVNIIQIIQEKFENLIKAYPSLDSELTEEEWEFLDQTGSGWTNYYSLGYE